MNNTGIFNQQTWPALLFHKAERQTVASSPTPKEYSISFYFVSHFHQNAEQRQKMQCSANFPYAVIAHYAE